MPRETIIPVCPPYEVKVGWKHAGDVQVGVEGQEGRSLFWLLLGTSPGALEWLGEQVEKLGQVDYGDHEERGRFLLNTLDTVSHGDCFGVWSTLDRHGCNDLIRILRRARDSAFGRDE